MNIDIKEDVVAYKVLKSLNFSCIIVLADDLHGGTEMTELVLFRLAHSNLKRIAFI